MPPPWLVSASQYEPGRLWSRDLGPLGSAYQGTVSADVGVRGALRVRITLAGSVSTDVGVRGSVRFSKYLRSRVVADLGMFGRVGVTPDPLRSRLTVHLGVAGTMSTRYALAGSVGIPATFRGDLRVPQSIRLFSRPLSVVIGARATPRVKVAPPNDLFANGTVLTGDAADATGTSVDATVETGEPFGFTSVWWRWTAPGNGSLAVTTSRSAYYAELGIYTGASVGALTALRERGQSHEVPVRNGETYHLRVYSVVGAMGAVTLGLLFTSTSLRSWTRDESQRFRVDVGAVGLLNVRAGVVPPPRSFDPLYDPSLPDSPASVARREEAIRVYRYSLTFPPPTVDANGFPRGS